MEAVIRLSAFLGILLIMLIWEFYSPRRPLRYSRWLRWPVNISLSVLSIVLVRFTVGAMAFLAAVSAQEMNWGLLNLIDLPYWLSMLLGLVLLDLAIYGQHVASHHWKWLWRLHKIHHTDLDFDVTTAVRFHPFEILISMVYKVLLIYIIGIEPMVIIVFEVILSGSALFNHSNVYIPVKVDKWLRKLIVTPDMHRIHHSAIQKETDSNYGFALSIWDRLFGNYTDEPKYGQTGMMVGLTQYRYSHDVSIKQLLLMPFK